MNIRLDRLLKQSLGSKTKVALLVITVSLGLSYAFPIWRMHLVAPQYPEGLDLYIYTYKVEGGNDGQHIQEINTLNHYIGMHPLDESQLKDLDWLPFAVSILGILALRLVVLGTLRGLVDLFVISCYVSLFGLFRFAHKLYYLGHSLDPEAPVNIKPFMPVVIGKKQIANFTTTSLPSWGSFFLAVFVLTILFLIVLHLVKGWNKASEPSQ